jgi:hypothetical protein
VASLDTIFRVDPPGAGYVASAIGSTAPVVIPATPAAHGWAYVVLALAIAGAAAYRLRKRGGFASAQ